MREAFAIQNILTFFSTKSIDMFQVLMVEILTKLFPNTSLLFEQLGPGFLWITATILFTVTHVHLRYCHVAVAYGA